MSEQKSQVDKSLDLPTYLDRSTKIAEDIDTLSLLSSVRQSSLFAAVENEGRKYIILPKNIETVADSMLLTLVAYICRCNKMEGFPSNDEVAREKIVDCEWQPAHSYFAGVLRGISGLLKDRPDLTFPTKTPFSEGVWYVQSRMLRNAKLKELAITIPKVTGIFHYTNTKGKGLTLVESTNLVKVLNDFIDKIALNNKLIRLCLISPEVLKTRQVLKHKLPSSKKVIYFPGEIQALSKQNYEIAKLIDPLLNAFDKVQDIVTYNKYVDEIYLYNRNYTRITEQADKVASGRYPLLFSKGLKGDFTQRVESLDLDGLNKICPVDWDGLAKPYTYHKAPEKFYDYFTQLDRIEKLLESSPFKAAFSEWRHFVNKLPVIQRAIDIMHEEKFGGSKEIS